MVERLTAEQARELAGPTKEERISALLDEALEKVRQAADRKERSITLRSGFWADEAYRQTILWKAVASDLRDLGYTVERYYVESQFADIGTTIKW